MIDLTISIVNYNVKDQLESCLKSIYKETLELSFEVIVVDNASSDKSIEMIKVNFPQVKLIANRENLFFSKAHNQAYNVSSSRYFLLLNPDTIIRDNVFKKMIDFMDSIQEVGACGPKLVNERMEHEWSGENFPDLLYGIYEVSLVNAVFPSNSVKRRKIMPDWDRNDTREVDTIGGSCLMIRREIVQKTGLLDEKFTLYWEEIDWCKRIKEAGYKVYFFASAIIIHYWGTSTSLLDRRVKDKHYFNSLLYYYKKNFGQNTFFILRLLYFFMNVAVNIKRTFIL
ncbi:MAG: hypothetical protein A2297_06980 [Elusimicrobia bacterium RIFOXYB2_FULL_48_7]|nr:MAG: hypothetical protein A2297_06980 [Elusimicrobia bacterium RIFOXYB2_FULL_48_7]